MRVIPHRLEGYQLLQDGAIALAQVESNGIRINMGELQEVKVTLQSRIRDLRADLENDAVWRLWKRRYGPKANMTSREQLGEVLHVEMDFEVGETTDSGRPAMDDEALQKIDHPFVVKLRPLFRYEKALGTFIAGIERETINGRLHPFFNLHTVRSYRSSSDTPNFQNFPVRDKEVAEIIRRLFIASRDSVLVENDFKGIEVGVSACVVGDTVIQTLDGNQSIQEVVSRLKAGDDVWVFSYSKEKGRIALSRVLDGGLTRKKAVVWEVVLDNGEKIKATPDHSFLLRTGTYRQLKDLQPGDSLMPLYRQKKVSGWKTVYNWVYLNNGKSEAVHNLVADDIFGVQIRGSQKVVHHKDGNGCHNSISNLEVMDRSAHMRIHSKQGWKNKGQGKRWTGWWDSSVSKKMNADRQVTWTDCDWQEFGRKVSEGIAGKGGRFGSRNPRFGKRQTEETRRKISEAKKGKPGPWLGRHHSAATKRKISLKKKGVPSGNKGIKLGPLSETHRKLLSERMKGRVLSKSTRQKLSKNKYQYWSHLKKEGPKAECPFCGKKMISLGSHVRHKHPVQNHKVVSIRKVGRADVFNLNVEGAHNYAVGAGVVIKNCYHKDSNFISYITTPGKDMHRDMAAQIYFLEPEQVTKDTRYGAKNKFVFPQFYGDFYVSCARSLWEWVEQGKLLGPDGKPLKTHLRANGIVALGACDPDQEPKEGTFEKHLQEVEHDFWNKRFMAYGRWRKDWYKLYLDQGYFDLLSGFRVYGMFKRNAVVNYPVQGSAFHCLLWTLIQVQKRLRKYRMRSKIVGQIHDSLLGDVREDELRDYLEIVEHVVVDLLPKRYPWLIVPLEIEYEISPRGGSWFEKREVKFKRGQFQHPKHPERWTGEAEKFLAALGR